ncbi:MAG TPA: DUF2946 family protein [Reyranella sp.]|nr:DUF2946 family protein [Reyranella sp.]
MIAARPVSGWRAMAFAIALMALTVNFLQPLTHAVLMRDGAPGALWTVFCNASVADPDSHKGESKPVAYTGHDCCLGLAHAAAMVEPSAAFTLVARISTIEFLPAPFVAPTAAGIRDGPSQPRGPPSFPV